jgi:multidrug efflux pump subunit AcrB
MVDFPLTTASGAEVPLARVAAISLEDGPEALWRVDMRPAIDLVIDTFDPVGDTCVGYLEREQLDLPAGIGMVLLASRRLSL